MASTAAGVAVGSSIGHGISSMFGGGGGSSEPQEQQQQEQYSNQPMPAQYQNGNSCEADAKAFTQCLEATNNDMNSCSWYLEQLKACQRAAAPY